VPKLLRQTTYRARELRGRATPAERVLWSLLRRHALGSKFRRQHPLGPFIVDFFCFDAGLVVEVDGAVHDTPCARERDAERDVFLQNCGLRIVRVRNEQVLQSPDLALAIIRAALDKART
jgi:very-short-patch-repair endonuclease